MSSDGWLPPGVCHTDVEYAAGWRPKQTAKAKAAEKSQEALDERCYACNKPLKKASPRIVLTSDGQPVYVGPDCGRKIDMAGSDGYQPPLGGPRLYAEP
jgi:hypothetical protein